jgi:hypothetical protein
MKESIKKIIENGGKIEFYQNGKPICIWKSNIRKDYWIGNQCYLDLDCVVDVYLKKIKK